MKHPLSHSSSSCVDVLIRNRLFLISAPLSPSEYLSANIQVMEQLRTSVTLFCDVKTTANAPMYSNITWFRNQHEVKSDDRFRANNFKLLVRTNSGHNDGQVAQKPAGTVRCGAHSSRAGMIFSKPFDLDGLFDRIENRIQRRRRPGERHQKRSNDSPRRIMTYTEDQIVLSCRLAAAHGAFIEWTRDGKSFRTSREENPGDGKWISGLNLIQFKRLIFPFSLPRSNSRGHGQRQPAHLSQRHGR